MEAVVVEARATENSFYATQIIAVCINYPPLTHPGSSIYALRKERVLHSVEMQHCISTCTLSNVDDRKRCGVVWAATASRL